MNGAAHESRPSLLFRPFLYALACSAGSGILLGMLMTAIVYFQTAPDYSVGIMAGCLSCVFALSATTHFWADARYGQLEKVQRKKAEPEDCGCDLGKHYATYLRSNQDGDS